MIFDEGVGGEWGWELSLAGDIERGVEMELASLEPRVATTEGDEGGSGDLVK